MLVPTPVPFKMLQETQKKDQFDLFYESYEHEYFYPFLESSKFSCRPYFNYFEPKIDWVNMMCFFDQDEWQGRLYAKYAFLFETP